MRSRHSRPCHPQASISTRHPLVTALVVLFPITTAGLGVWQLQRQAWKAQLLESVDKAIKADPIRGTPCCSLVPPPPHRARCRNAVSLPLTLPLQPKTCPTSQLSSPGLGWQGHTATRTPCSSALDLARVSGAYVTGMALVRQGSGPVCWQPFPTRAVQGTPAMGYFAVVPMALEGGGVVLVNRGWVPDYLTKARREGFRDGGPVQRVGTGSRLT